MFKILSYFIDYRFLLRISILINRLFTISISKKFKTIGENCKLQYPSRIEGMTFVEIGKNFSCGKNLRLQAISKYHEQEFYPSISIGNDVTINPNCQIVAVNRITIKDNVLLASNVFISDHSHGKSDFSDINIDAAQRELYSKGEIIIEENVWIGQNVSILAGVTVGRNSIIGANSVVTKDVPCNSIAVGVPARVIKTVNPSYE